MTELKIIKNIVDIKTGLDISTKTRKTDYINARCIYYKIVKTIFKRKYSLQSMATVVNLKDHATILNSLNNFDEYISRDIILFNLYIKCLDAVKKSLNIDLDKEDIYVKYTRVVEELNNLKLEKIEQINNKLSIKDDDELINEIKQLTEKQLAEFKHRSSVILKSIKKYY